MTGGFTGRSRGHGGFTLIEVLLAITLVALIMAMAYGGFRASVRAAESGEAIIEENNRLRVAHQFVRRQLMLARSLVIEELEIDDGVQVRFEGESGRVRFVSPMPGYLSYGGPYVQQFSIEPGAEGYDLVYYYAMLNGYEPGDLEETTDGIVLIEGLRRGEFFFLAEDEDAPEETYWTDLWEDPERLPLAVALEMDLDRDNGIAWPDLVARVMMDSARDPGRRQIRRASDMLAPRDHRSRR